MFKFQIKIMQIIIQVLHIIIDIIHIIMQLTIVTEAVILIVHTEIQQDNKV